MRFSVLAAALFAGAALAAPALEERGDVDLDDVDYEYDVVTVTSCHPTVTNCPAHSTVTYTTPKSAAAPKMTTSTVYTTKLVTITSCASTVTYCPAHSTVVVTSTIAVSTTVCPVTEVYTSTPYVSASPVKSTPYATPVAPKASSSVYYAVPSYTVITVSSCVPTVTYSTVYNTPKPYVPPGTVKPSASAVAPKASSTVYPVAPKNAT
ncbi:hypothetical protein GP486_008359, partial [Trichoglossum hirsutum]